MFKVLLVFFLSLTVISKGHSVEKTNEAYVVSDSQINDFLQKFIESSVNNVTMLMEFITKLMRDAMGKSQSSLTENKINYYATTRNT
jgi:hypothetical protein